MCSTKGSPDYCCCYAHVSCLLHEKRVAVADTAHSQDPQDRVGIFTWVQCRICGKPYDTAATVVLGYGCWATYLHQWANNNDEMPSVALGITARSLLFLERFEEALPLYEATQVRIRRMTSHIPAGANFQQDAYRKNFEEVLNCYYSLGRLDDALRLCCEMWEGFKDAHGPSHEISLRQGLKVVALLDELRNFNESNSFAGEQLLLARRALGNAHEITRRLVQFQAHAAPFVSSSQEVAEEAD